MVNRMTISLRSYSSVEVSSGNPQSALPNMRSKHVEYNTPSGPTGTATFSTFIGIVDRSHSSGTTDSYELNTRMTNDIESIPC